MPSSNGNNMPEFENRTLMSSSHLFAVGCFGFFFFSECFGDLTDSTSKTLLTASLPDASPLE